ncbi:hypothetical protein ASG52_22650 [Methylobacterium sp. Leaf456]|uniref:hypothetical protein n=1 Tax=Methylobacterium sp. Leaf456 TaxID=1736382 RepID=UPI0007016B26|nr:hypothetical protein [Methylobacterium sp. Leaf456]KQT58250.1 hypothetical protein ASG52_22650 [Methylobacterium sp. Leaf456]
MMQILARLRPTGRLAGFGAMDWVFVFLAWLTLWYLALNILDHLAPVPQRPFDVLPVLAGIPVVILGWKAVRLREDLDETVDRLDDGAGLVSSGDTAILAFSTAFRTSLDLSARVAGGTVAAIMIVGFVYAIMTSLLPDTMNTAWWILFILLGFVMVSVGFIVGQLLGRFVGFGFLNRVMERHQVTFASLSTPGAQRAVRSMERLLTYALLTTMTLCHWFALCFAMWTLGYLQDYDNWETLYFVLWMISISLYLGAAWFPGLKFSQRLDRLYGDQTVRAALDSQLVEAKAELDQLRKASDGSRRSDYEIAELTRFIASLSASRFRSFWLKPVLLHGFLAWNIVLFLGLAVVGRS